MSKTTFPELCAMAGLPPPVAEYRFHPVRRWRFDFAFVDARIAVEVEGGIWSGGRHNQAAGFLRDMEKYNAAACMGWRVLRLTPKSIGTLTASQLVKEALAV